jgi:hypothetical protein
MKTWIVYVVCILGVISLALTPQERQFALNARKYMEVAKEQAIREQRIHEELDRRAQEAERTVDSQSKQIGTLSDQVEKAHKNEQAAVAYNQYAKPIIDQVNSHWGLGAIWYGIKRLFAHVFIASIVIGGVLLALVIAFPAVGAGLKVAWGAIVSVFRRLKK